MRKLVHTTVCQGEEDHLQSYVKYDIDNLLKVVENMKRDGITTAEIKHGVGNSIEVEIKRWETDEEYMKRQSYEDELAEVTEWAKRLGYDLVPQEEEIPF